MNTSLVLDTNLQASLSFFESALFHDIQMSGIFCDSKDFADSIPRGDLSEIYSKYEAESKLDSFDLMRFIDQHFLFPAAISLNKGPQELDLKSYISSLWSQLERMPDAQNNSSLIPLKNKYIVPGGRFREIYYWDSYFTSLGLVISKRQDLVESMIDNFSDLQSRIGCIPNGNRSYYYSRSQPPVLSSMVAILADEGKCSERRELLIKHLPAMEKEYQFWMRGADKLSNTNNSLHRCVLMPNGAVLNRYWDDSTKPRPESLREDIENAQAQSFQSAADYYRNIRAACESGWDFSSRWLAQANELSSIQTTHIVPIDLNSLLFQVEQHLSQFFAEIGEQGKANDYAVKAVQRKAAINLYLWEQNLGFYFDYNFKTDKNCQTYSLASCLPLFVQLASNEQALSVSHCLQSKFLQKGGLVTTLSESPQQWDSPNGWAPLQWFAVKGLLNFGHKKLAMEIVTRWLTTLESYYAKHHTLMEKYNVKSIDEHAQGGEYSVQHGFGWTNGVALAFYRLLAT